jgi:signal transduction histidine kinase
MNTWLENLPPTSRQRRAALAVSAILLVLLGIVAPFSSKQLPQINSFIPSFEAMVFTTDLVTSVLLYSQFSISRGPALLALASGYLFTAIIVIPHALTFPGAFSETGLLGAGLQSTGWLYWFWHLGFPLAVLAYGLLKNESQPERERSLSRLSAISLSVVFVVALVCGLTLLATAGDSIMPPLNPDRVHISLLNHAIAAVALLVCMLALAVLYARQNSVLDLWLMVVIVAAISELVLAVALVSTRFSLGYYAGRMFSLVTATTVLVVLLIETARLYARLSRSYAMLQRERDSKLVNIEAVAASIAHELKQPLAGIAISNGAASRWLRGTPPDLEEARSAHDAISRDVKRATEVFDDILALFRISQQNKQAIDVNEIALEALNILRENLTDHGVKTQIELTTELPQIMGNRGQLLEVMINLVRNAVEAMDAVEYGNRLLQVKTRLDGRETIAVAVEDSGPGIDREKLESIFDAFVTTKPQGQGLGLALCRMIIERHGGELSARSNQRSGALLQFILPIKSEVR